RMRDSGAKAGVKLYTIVPAEKPQPVVAEEEEAPDEVGDVEEAEATNTLALAAAAAKKKRTTMLAAAVAVGVVILGGAGVMLFSKPKGESTNVIASRPKKIEAPSGPKAIFIQPFTVEGTDPVLTDRANAVRLASIEWLRTLPAVHVAVAAGPDATAFTATVRGGATGPEIVTGSATPVPMSDAASGIQTVVQEVAKQLNVPLHPATSAAAYNAFADAVVANSASDPKKTDASLRAAIKADPNFLPAELMAMRFYTAQAKDVEATAAAKQVLAADPSNLDAARIVAHSGLKSGDVP